jgi:hypothetical protein
MVFWRKRKARAHRYESVAPLAINGTTQRLAWIEQMLRLLADACRDVRCGKGPHDVMTGSQPAQPSGGQRRERTRE